MFEAKSDSVGIDLHVKIGGKTGLWVEPTELTKPLFSVLSVLHTGHFLHQSQHWRSIPPESDFASNIEDFLRPTIAILRFINLCCPLS